MDLYFIFMITALAILVNLSATEEEVLGDDPVAALVAQQQQRLLHLETHVDLLTDELETHKAHVGSLQLRAGRAKGGRHTTNMHRLSTHPRGLIKMPSVSAEGRAMRPECNLGNAYEYEEKLDMHATNCTTPMSTSMPWECLLQCSKDLGCLGVDMAYAAGEMTCYECFDMSAMTMKTGTNHYHLLPLVACFVATPQITFQVTICNTNCYGEQEIIMWDEIRANTSNRLWQDGKFNIPVSGTYEFNIHLAISEQSNESASVNLMLDGVQVGAVTVDNSVAGAANTFSITCGADQQVWVETGTDRTNCIHGSCTDWETNFSGRLITLKE